MNLEKLQGSQVRGQPSDCVPTLQRCWRVKTILKEEKTFFFFQKGLGLPAWLKSSCGLV